MQRFFLQLPIRTFAPMGNLNITTVLSLSLSYFFLFTFHALLLPMLHCKWVHGSIRNNVYGYDIKTHISISLKVFSSLQL